MFVGTESTGEIGYGECVSGLACYDDRCSRLPAHGDSCTGACRDVGDRCRDGVCASVSVEGDACTPAADGSSNCELSCVNGQCAVGVAEGEACGEYVACADMTDFCDSTFCDESDFDAPTLCAALPVCIVLD